VLRKGHILAIFVIGVSIITIPSAFADVSISIPTGASIPGCQNTNECYIPTQVTVNVGDTVTWSNDDSAAHTVTSGVPSDADSVGAVFDSSLFLVGDTFSLRFNEDGQFPYFCIVHPWMTGIVTVVGENIPKDESKDNWFEAFSLVSGVRVDSKIIMLNLNRAFPETLSDLDYKKYPIVNTSLDNLRTGKYQSPPLDATYEEEVLINEINRRYLNYMNSGLDEGPDEVEIMYQKAHEKLNLIDISEKEYSEFQNDLVNDKKDVENDFKIMRSYLQDLEYKIEDDLRQLQARADLIGEELEITKITKRY